MIPIVVLQCIIDLLDFKTQINIKNSCKYFYESLYITNMDVYLRQCRKITNDVIKKHDKLLYLNLYENRVVTDLSNQRYIKQLQISMASIGYEGIKHLKDLEVLNISNNSNYFDITNFQNLRELYIRGFNNIRYEDLLKLPKLQTVHVISNYYKKDIIALLKNKVKVED